VFVLYNFKYKCELENVFSVLETRSLSADLQKICIIFVYTGIKGIFCFLIICAPAMLRTGIVFGGVCLCVCLCVCLTTCNLVGICPMVNAITDWKLVRFNLDL